MADPYDRENKGEQSYNPPGSDEPRTIHKNPAETPKDGAEPRDDIRNAEESFYNPTGDEVRRHSVDRANLALAELSGAKAGSDSGLFNQNADNGNPKVFKSLKNTLKQRRKVLAGGGAAAGVGAIMLTTFFLLIPLKIEHIVNNLESHFFSSSNSAIEQETQNMFEKYMVKNVLPSYKSCGTTIDKNCTVRVVGNGPVSHLYRTWANAKLENKLATDYGIEFKYHAPSKTWYLKAPGSNVAGDNIGPNGGGLESDFQRSDRAGMRASINDALQNETRWKNVVTRYKVGRLLEEKYGIKRCIMFCGTRDQLAGKVDAQKKSAQLYIVQRVITPRTASLGIVLECMLNNCDPTQTQPTAAQDGSTGELNGSPENPETDTAIREADQQISKTFVTQSAEGLLSGYTDIAEKGFQRYLLEEVLTKVGLGGVASQAADAVPVVGWVIAASHVISFANHAGPAVQKLGYIVNSGADAQTFQLYNTYASEIHTGHVNAVEVGSMTNSLGPGDRGTPSDPQVGGTAGAENTPLYQNLIDGKSPSPATAFNQLLPAKAYAASAGNSSSSTYKCNDNKPVPAGKLVCPNEVLGQSNGSLDTVHQFLNLPVIGQVTYVANQVSGIAGVIGNLLGNIITSIPGLGSAIQSVSGFVGGVLQPFFTDVINVLIPNAFSTVMSGGRVFDIMAGGADAAGNLFAQVGIGGQALTPQQSADIINQQQTEAQQTFSHQSFFARMFSTDSQYSLVSKVAVSIPFGLQADAQIGVANLLNPLSTFSHGFGSILSGRANAAVSAQPDPFGVTQYGYPPGDIPSDPETYWDQHCSDDASNAYMKDNSWNEAASSTVDPNTGMPENKTTNPCLLIKASVGGAGGLFDTTLLTQDDVADATGSGGGGSSAPTTAANGLTNPFPDGWIPNRLDMGYDGTFKNKIVAPFSGTITYASDSFSNWGGYIEIKADQKPSGLPTSTLYFAEGVKPTVHSGHVNAGDQIASSAPSPFGDPYGTGSSGSIEWGLAQEGSVGSPTNTYVYGKCGSSAAKSAVLGFSQWAQQNLGLPPPSQTSNAGCP